jgi:hypothetical protein
MKAAARAGSPLRTGSTQALNAWVLRCSVLVLGARCLVVGAWVPDGGSEAEHPAPKHPSTEQGGAPVSAPTLQKASSRLMQSAQRA